MKDYFRINRNKTESNNINNINMNNEEYLKLKLIIIGLLFSSSFFIHDAFAYLDPGTGSIVIQALIGALIGVGITLKIYWYKLKEKIFGIHKKK